MGRMECSRTQHRRWRTWRRAICREQYRTLLYNRWEMNMLINRRVNAILIVAMIIHLLTLHFSHIAWRIDVYNPDNFGNAKRQHGSLSKANCVATWSSSAKSTYHGPIWFFEVIFRNVVLLWITIITNKRSSNQQQQKILKMILIYC